MKKVLLAVLILVLCATPLLFTACGSVSQRDLLTTSYVCSQNGYEYFEYDIFHADDDGKFTEPVGSMSMKFEPLKEKAVTLPCVGEEKERTFDSYNGTLLTMKAEFTNGDTILSQVIYSSSCRPKFSYKCTNFSGVKKEMQVSYKGKYLYAKRYVNGVQKSSVRHKASGCYDNESLYAIIRASSIGDASYSLSYTCVNPLTGNADDMSISRTGSIDDAIAILTPKEYELPEGKEKFTTPTYVFRITTDNEYAGSYYVEITKNSQTVENDKINIKNVKKVITTIVEGEYKYALSNVEIV